MKKPLSPNPSAAPTTLLALHGFTGSGLDFEPVQRCFPQDCQWICPDLPGHGTNADDWDSRSISLADAMETIQRARGSATDPAEIILLGYSMGGRLALHYALRYPVRRLILIGASPGLREPAEREARCLADQRWMRQLRDAGMEIGPFCRDWESQPLIAPQTRIDEPERTELARRRRLNNPLALANALEGLGTGVLPDLWSALSGLPETDLLHGAEDEKFAVICRQMQEVNPALRIHSIAGCGHAPHLENPATLVRVLRSIISV